MPSGGVTGGSDGGTAGASGESFGTAGTSVGGSTSGEAGSANGGVAGVTGGTAGAVGTAGASGAGGSSGSAGASSNGGSAGPDGEAGAGGESPEPCQAEVSSDPLNCGACGAACSSEHVSATCTAGECSGSCSPDYADCNANKRLDGCEIDLSSDPQHCGDCNTVCSLPGATAVCDGGECTVEVCNARRLDCDEQADNGCEVDADFDAQHCGACDKACKEGMLCHFGQCRAALCKGTLGLPSPGLNQTGVGPWDVVTGDLNGDGKLDLVVGNGGVPGSNQGSVSVLVGFGNGRFAPKVDYSTGTNSTLAVALADIDRDGDLDVAASSLNSSTVSLLLNDGHGVLAPFVSQPIHTATLSIAFADLDGKNGPDLLTTSADDTLSVHLNTGAGSFGDDVEYAVEGEALAVRTADINGDGAPDAVVSSNYASSKVCVFLNQNAGDGLLGARQDYPTFSANHTFGPGLAVGDLNDDGYPDIATLGAIFDAKTSTVSILLNDGAGSFLARRDYEFELRPFGQHRLTVGDFNGDGALDVLLQQEADAPNDDITGVLAILFNDGDGTFSTSWGDAIGLRMRGESVAADFNDDGRADLAVTEWGNVDWQQPTQTNSVGIFLSDPDGSLAARDQYGVELGPYDVDVGDFDRDGAPDLVVPSPGADFDLRETVTVMHNLGDGTFESTEYQTGAMPTSAAFADMDGDTWPDIVVVSSELLSVFPNEQDGTFGPRQDTPVTGQPALHDLAPGDFDGNGTIDVAVVDRNLTSTVTLYLNSGGTLTPGTPYPIAYHPQSIRAADFNRDGRLDVVVTNADYNNSFVSVLLNAGNGKLSPKTEYATGHTPQSVAIADLDLDGTLDLATGNAESHDITILLGIGNGKFYPKATIPGAGGGWITATDIDSDGYPDLVAGGLLSFHRNLGSGSFAPPVTLESAVFNTNIASGDFNLDGRPDLVTTHTHGIVAIHQNRCW